MRSLFGNLNWNWNFIGMRRLLMRARFFHGTIVEQRNSAEMSAIFNVCVRHAEGLCKACGKVCVRPAKGLSKVCIRPALVQFISCISCMARISNAIKARDCGQSK